MSICQATARNVLSDLFEQSKKDEIEIIDILTIYPEPERISIKTIAIRNQPNQTIITWKNKHQCTGDQ